MVVGTSNPSILLDLAMVLGTAAITTVICQRFRLPLVLGYLVAGLIIGPHVPVPLVADLHNINTLSELGIILLMFSLGLDFSLKKLLRAGPPASLIALIKTGFLTWAGYLAGRFLGWSAMESIFAGAALGISSTMIIARVYQRMGIRGPVADLVLSALIVEDLLAILMLTLLTGVGSGAGLHVSALLLTLGRLVGFLVAVLALGRWVVPRFIRWVADMGHDETLLITGVGLCFALSLLASKMGYSVALGAFLAGMLVAESGRERKVEHLLAPLKDVFVAIFFVSVGMLIDPGQVLPNWKALLIFGMLVFFGKFVTAAFGALLGGSALRTSLWIGGSLTQIGEFSFIIVALGQKLGVVGPALFPIMVVTSAWTTMTTPLLIKHSDALADRFERYLPRRLRFFLMHHRAAMGHLAAIPLRKAPWKSLRRPFAYLVLDSLMVVAAALVASLANHVLGDLVRGYIPQSLAAYGVWSVVGLLAFRFLLGMQKQVRTIAGTMARRALQSSGSTVEGMEEAVRFFLEIAISLMVVLPMIAVLQPFLPTRVVSCLVGVGLVVFGVVFWRRTGAIEKRRMAGSQGLIEKSEE